MWYSLLLHLILCKLNINCSSDWRSGNEVREEGVYRGSRACLPFIFNYLAELRDTI